MPKVIYRPAGMFYSLDEAMKQAKIFDSVEGIMDYIAKRLTKRTKEMRMFNVNLSYDVIIEKEPFNDDRTGWKDVHRICLKNVMYCTPKCVGYCAYKWS